MRRDPTLADYAARDLAEIGELYPVARSLIEPGPTSARPVVTAAQLAEMDRDVRTDRAYRVWQLHHGVRVPGAHPVPARLGIVGLVADAEHHLVVLADQLRAAVRAGPVTADELRAAGWQDRTGQTMTQLGHLRALRAFVTARYDTRVAGAGTASERAAALAARYRAAAGLDRAMHRLLGRLDGPPPATQHVVEACRRWLCNGLFGLAPDRLRSAAADIRSARRSLEIATGEASLATVSLDGATCPDCGMRGSMRAALDDPDRVRWYIVCSRATCPSTRHPWATWDALSERLGGLDLYSAMDSAGRTLADTCGCDCHTGGGRRRPCSVFGGCASNGCDGRGHITDRRTPR